MGFGSDLGFQEAGVKAGDFFVSFQGMEEGEAGQYWGFGRIEKRLSREL